MIIFGARTMKTNSFNTLQASKFCSISVFRLITSNSCLNETLISNSNGMLGIIWICRTKNC